MIKNNRGFSLAVLVISIAVIVIITSTAVITIKNISKDRGISEFMTDLTDVKQYIIEYVNKDGTLPAKSEFDNLGNEMDAEETLLSTLEAGNALGQIDQNDVGPYYFVDIAKLGKIHLSDEERKYIFNEGTLNVYVLKPYEYNGTKYYTLTSDLSGRTSSSNRNVPFDVSITGNPVTWTNSAEILVSVTNAAIGDGVGWNFRWLKGSHTVDDFKLASEVNYFTYGQTITLTENGVYTINVEDPDGIAIARKIVITKIDDIPPKVVRKDGKIYLDDAETGIRGIRYKIKESNNFTISTEARADHPEVYTMEDEEDSDTQEQLLRKYLWGEKNIKGERIENYLAKYSIYYEKLKEYNETKLNPESTTPIIENTENAIKILNKNYPQYAYNNRSFPNAERNIVLYVEDFAGNATIFSAVSRTELTNFQYVSNNKETLTDVRVIINNNNEFTNNRKVSLYMDALHAKFFFASEEENPQGTYKYFTNSKEEYTIVGEGDGQKTIYVIFEDESGDVKVVNDSIYLDETPPTKNAPTVSGNILRMNVTSNQTDAESGLNGVVNYGIKEQSQSDYKWFHSPSDFPVLEVGKTYKVVTKVTDKAGNEMQSDPTNFVSTNATIIARSSSTAFWQDTYRTKISSVTFKKGATTVPSGATDFGNLSTNTATSEIRAYAENDGSGGYKLTIVSPQTIYANADSSAYFKDFTNLKTTDFSNFNTSQVTNMNQMFMGCTALRTIDVDSFSTSNLQTMSEMFKNCSMIESVDLSNFDTSKVTTLASVFSGCTHLYDVNVAGLNTSKVTNMENMFNQCSALTNVSVSGFNTSIVTTMAGMFAGCSQLTSMDMSNFNSSQLRDTTNMFNGCSKLKTVYVSETFTSTGITSSGNMFKDASMIVGGNGTTYDATKVNAAMAHIDVSGNPGYFTLRWHFN